MGRFKALAAGVALLAVVLAPGMAGASTSAQTAIGWLCTPNGSAALGPSVIGPTTTLSTVAIYANPSDDWLACQFNLNQNPALKSISSSSFEFGGPCTFQPIYTGAGSQQIGTVFFNHRVYRVHGNQASLYCWDGFYD